MTTHPKWLDMLYWIAIPSAGNAVIRPGTLHAAPRATRRISRLCRDNAVGDPSSVRADAGNPALWGLLDKVTLVTLVTVGEGGRCRCPQCQLSMRPGLGAVRRQARHIHPCSAESAMVSDCYQSCQLPAKLCQRLLAAA